MAHVWHREYNYYLIFIVKSYTYSSMCGTLEDDPFPVSIKQYVDEDLAGGSRLMYSVILDFTT